MASAAMAQTVMQSLGQALTQPAPRSARAGLQVRPCPSDPASAEHTPLWFSLCQLAGCCKHTPLWFTPCQLAGCCKHSWAEGAPMLPVEAAHGGGSRGWWHPGGAGEAGGVSTVPGGPGAYCGARARHAARRGRHAQH